MIPALRAKVPLDVWLCSLLIAVSGVLFLVEGLVRYATEGGASIVTLPAIFCVLNLLAAVGLIVGVRFVRPTAVTILGLGAVLHLLVLAGTGHAWTRIASGVLLAAQLYAIVLLHTGPVRDHCGHVR
ncbi:MAG TPA: hypothetical protein VF444_13780 [Pseudonocardiaceae bacterium]